MCGFVSPEVQVTSFRFANMTENSTSQFWNTSTGVTIPNQNGSSLLEPELSHGVRLAAEILATYILIAGTAGNVLTIVAIIKSHKLRQIGNSFLISLSISDGLYCIVILPTRIITYHYGRWIFDPVICTILPGIGHLFTGASLSALAFIALNRYTSIVHTWQYKQLYTPVKTAIMLGVCWGFPFLMTIFSTAGIWGSYDYDALTLSCTFSKHGDQSYRRTLAGIAFAVPIVFITVCYARIFYFVHQARKRIQVQGSKSQRSQNIKKDSLKLTVTTSCIFTVFVVCILPFAMVNILDDEVEIPVLHVVTILFAWSETWLNPLVYVCMNKNFRDAYRSICCCVKKDSKILAVSTIHTKTDMY